MSTADNGWSSGGEDDAVVAALGTSAHAGEGGAMVRVVRGDPDDVELAALVAGIVAARSAGSGDGHPEEADVARAPWSDPGRALRLPPAPGPDAWRWSLHP